MPAIAGDQIRSIRSHARLLDSGHSLKLTLIELINRYVLNGECSITCVSMATVYCMTAVRPCP